MTMHVRQLQLLADPVEGTSWLLRSPGVGRFRPSVRGGARLIPGGVLGALEVLGTTYELVVPAGATGCVTDLELVPRSVQYGEVLAGLAPSGVAATAVAQVSAATAQTTGLVFRAPTSGRFYGRAAPDKPAFVSAGDELATGGTVCLLEVMKTFHRVHYGGADLPERVRVREVLVRDGDDVNAHDPVLALDPV